MAFPEPPLRQVKRVTWGGVDRPFDVLGPFHIDALCAAQRNDGNSIGYSCRENIGVQPRHNHLLLGSTICYRITSRAESFQISLVL